MSNSIQIHFLNKLLKKMMIDAILMMILLNETFSGLATVKILL